MDRGDRESRRAVVEETDPLAGLLPRGIPPKLMPLVDTSRWGPLTSPVAESGTWEVPLLLVVMVTLPPTRPPAVGAKVIGTVNEEPVPKSAGRAGLGLPSVKSPLETESLVIVMSWLAVTRKVSVAFFPTTVDGKVGEAAVTGAETGAPNPITYPSRVPT